MINYDVSLPEAVARSAERLSDKKFLQEVDGASISYGEFIEKSQQWASALESAGVQDGDRVATMLDNCIDGAVIWGALSWLCAVDTSVSVQYRGSLLAHVLNVSAAKILFTDAECLDGLATCASELKHLRTIVLRDPSPQAITAGQAMGFEVYGRDDFFGKASPRTTSAFPGTWNIACVVFTSGTTGPSKGSMVPWRQLATGGYSLEGLGLREDDVFYHTGAASHTIGRFTMLLTATLGATMVLKKTFKTQDFWNDIDRYGCTFTNFVGAMSHFILSQPPDASDSKHPLRLVSMAPVHPQYEEFKKRFGVEVYTAYGMTECFGPFNTVGYGIEDPKSCGRVRTGWPYFEARLVDEHDEEVPTGQVGELMVRTGVPWAMTAGYIGMPDRTAEAWRNGWFHTGDGFRKGENGLYYFSDRLKDVIRRRGENISSFEVEAEVNRHPCVAECAVIAVPAEDIEDEIKVFVVPREGPQLDPAELIHFLAKRMTRFMIPRYIEIVSELPKTHTLRVKKAELRARPSGKTWDRVVAGIDIR